MTRTYQYIKRQTVVLLVVLGLLLGLGVGALAANQRITDADANLEKAFVLVQAARDDGRTEMEGRAYDRALRKAQRDIARARAHLADAVAIADAP